MVLSQFLTGQEEGDGFVSQQSDAAARCATACCPHLPLILTHPLPLSFSSCSDISAVASESGSAKDAYTIMMQASAAQQVTAAAAAAARRSRRKS